MTIRISIDQTCDMLQVLRTAVDRATAKYIHKTPVCTYQIGHYPVSLDIRDLLIIGAITGSDVLLTGKTGSGKTTLAVDTVRGLFGDNSYYSKTTLPTMNPSEFMDIDFPAIIEGRKTMKEAVSGVQALIQPAIILNEVNRAPDMIQSLLIAFLDNQLEVQGVPIQMGREWNGSRYQFRILTINEGDAYQVQPLDPAIRDRMTIEIPVDAFPQSKNDVLRMLSGADGVPDESTPPSDEGDADHFDLVMELRRIIATVPVRPVSALFLNYLSGMSYCVRAPRGNKESIELSPGVCEGCHHAAAFYSLCGNIKAPSSRILLKLQRIARAFALFRYWRSKNIHPPEVQPEDVVEAAPFVFYSKLSLNPLWIKTAGDRSRPMHGDRWTAIREIMRWVLRERFMPLFSSETEIGDLMHKVTLGQPLILADWENIQTFMRERDPWICDPLLVRQNLLDEDVFDR